MQCVGLACGAHPSSLSQRYRQWQRGGGGSSNISSLNKQVGTSCYLPAYRDAHRGVWRNAHSADCREATSIAEEFPDGFSEGSLTTQENAIEGLQSTPCNVCKALRLMAALRVTGTSCPLTVLAKTRRQFFQAICNHDSPLRLALRARGDAVLS